MPFYLFGSGTQVHIEHVLLKDQNVQLAGSQVQLSVSPRLTPTQLSKGLVAILTNRYERAMQPSSELHKPEFFVTGAASHVTIYEDPFAHSTDPKIDMRDFIDRVTAQPQIAAGTLTLGPEVYNDATHLNQDILSPVSIRVAPDADTHAVLKSVKAAVKKPDVWLSDDVKGALHAKVPALLHDRTADQHTKVHVSRFALQKPHDRCSRVAAVRDEWMRAVESVGRYRY